MSSEIADYLIARDTHTDSSADRLAGHFAGDHIRIASYEASEKLHDRDLEI